MSLTMATIAKDSAAQMFTALDGLLQKGADHARAGGVDEAVYLGWRLAPDMFSLDQQIRIATELPARALSRLAGVEPPDYGRDETTFEEMRERVSRARAHVASLPEDALAADPDAPITFPAGGGSEMTLARRVYLQSFILPNLHFHVTAAYIILRRLGVDLGKRDFLAVPA